METQIISKEEFFEAFKDRDPSFENANPLDGFTCGHEPLNEHGRGWYPYEAYNIIDGEFVRDIVNLDDV